jgi:uroporphyrinogen-III synthase
VISLRAAEQNGALRKHARKHGFRLLALPGLQLVALDATDPLRAALDCAQCVFSSPAAVRCAQRLLPLRSYRGQAYAVGAGTAAALRRAGVADVVAPARQMRSEGLLDLPGLRAPAPAVGLVTAPGGRGLIESTLAARGAQLVVVHVYRREPARLSARARAALHAQPAPAAVLVSSLEAVDNVLAQLDAVESAVVRAALPVAASARIGAALRERGFREAAIAASARPAALVAALVGGPDRTG